jgi:hypothetical protein
VACSGSTCVSYPFDIARTQFAAQVGYAMLCYTVLYCTVLCCAMICYAVRGVLWLFSKSLSMFMFMYLICISRNVALLSRAGLKFIIAYSGSLHIQYATPESEVILKTIFVCLKHLLIVRSYL